MSGRWTQIEVDMDVEGALEVYEPQEATAEQLHALIVQRYALYTPDEVPPTLGRVRAALSRMAASGTVERVVGLSGLRGWRRTR